MSKTERRKIELLEGIQACYEIIDRCNKELERLNNPASAAEES